jgi:hypothetical protein
MFKPSYYSKAIFCGTIISAMITICSLSSVHAAYVPPNTNRVDIDFNVGWKYYQGDVPGAQATGFGDGAWGSVVLPHSTKFVTPDDMLAYEGISWYRKHFTVNSAYNGRKIYLQFGAAMQTADVYINGTSAGHHDGGYMEFTLDITRAVVYGGDNVIAVKVNSSANAGWAPGKTGIDFQYHGGLYRDVLMYVTDNLHVTDAVFADKVAGGGIYVTYPSITVSSATVNIKTEVFNEYSATKNCTVLSEITDAQGNLVQSATSTVTINANTTSSTNQSIILNNPHLWHPNSPYLYTLHTTINDGATAVDYYKTRIGIRSIQWTRTNGILLNSQSFKAQGINAHQDIYGLGNAIPKRSIYYEVKRMKEAGIQFIRGCHYPHAPEFYDACDELGILVGNCITGWQYYANTTAFNNSTYKETKDLIRRDRNRPCVAIWETQLNETNYTSAWATAVNGLAHQEGTQIVTCGTLADGSWGAMGTSSNTRWDVGLGASQANVRGNTASQPVIIGEYGDWDYGGFTSTSRVARESLDPPLLVQAGNIQGSLNKNRALSWYSADAYWQWSDYCGFPGSVTGVGNTTTKCGIVDMYRIPKFSYYFLQSQRDPTLVLSTIGSGPMVFIANRWTSGSPTTVKVFSNCEKVSLYRNTTLIGTRSPDNDANSTSLLHPPFTFTNVTFAAGELRAVGLIGTTEMATSIRRTPGGATAIRLRPENDTLLADGSDARLVWIDVVDANGTVVPDNTASVTVSVTGGSIVGPATITMRGGQLAFWVRGTTTPGTIVVTATSGILTPGTCTLVNISVATKIIGLSDKMPAMNSVLNNSNTFRVAGDKFVIPGYVMGKTYAVAVYSISGKLLKRLPVKKRTVNLSKEFGLSRGTYLLKVEVLSHYKNNNVLDG